MHLVRKANTGTETVRSDGTNLGFFSFVYMEGSAQFRCLPYFRRISVLSVSLPPHPGGPPADPFLLKYGSSGPTRVWRIKLFYFYWQKIYFWLMSKFNEAHLPSVVRREKWNRPGAVVDHPTAPQIEEANHRYVMPDLPPALCRSNSLWPKILAVCQNFAKI